MTNNFSCLSFKRVTGMFLAALVLSFVLIVGGALAMPPQQTFDFEIEAVDWFAVAAQTIGLENEAFYNEMDAGKSVAELAQAKGVDSQKVIEAIVAAETKMIKQQVADGTASQEEADKWLKSLPAEVKAFVENSYNEGDDKDENDPVNGMDWFEVAAQVMGMELDTLYNEFDAGKSVAELAQAKGVDNQKIIEAIVAAETKLIKEDVDTGVISQEEADTWLNSLPEDAKLFVESKDEDDSVEDVDVEFQLSGDDWFTVAAQTIGLDGETLYNEVEAGKSVADVVKEKGGDSQKVIEAIVAAETKATNQDVANSYLAQDEADEWLKALPAEAKLFVESNGVENDGFASNGYVESDNVEVEAVDAPGWFDVAAQAMGIDGDTLFNEVEAGKNVAEVAQAKGADSQTVIDAIVAADTQTINQAVTDEAVSQEEADEWLKSLPEDVKAFVEETHKALTLEGSEGDGVDSYTVAAQTIGVDVAVIDDALANGKSIAAVAQEKGVDSQTVIDAIVAAESEAINQAVANGHLTQDEADAWTKALPEDVKAFVEDMDEDVE